MAGAFDQRRQDRPFVRAVPVVPLDLEVDVSLSHLCEHGSPLTIHETYGYGPLLRLRILMNGISDYRRLLLQRHQQPLADATVMLGGGGARGLAHLGALRALGHSGIGVQRLVGVSMGALMAAMCAAERDVERVEMLARDFLESDRYRSLQQRVMGKAAGAPRSGSDDTSWTRRFRDLLWTTKAFGRAVASESLIPSTILEGIVDALLPDIDIEDLRKPLFLIAVDLQSGERVVLSRGSLRRAVVASMSIPGVFPAVEIDGRRLSDVGVYDAVPCDVARELMRLDRPEEAVASDASELGELIVVDVSLTKSDAVVCETALQSMLRVQELAEIRIRERQLELADVVVRPDVGEVPWYDFTQPEPLINAGYDAVKRALREKETGSMNPANPTSIAGSFVHSNPAPQP